MTRAADDRLPTPDEFRHAIARFPTGVATVTTIADGHDHAMTASSVSVIANALRLHRVRL